MKNTPSALKWLAEKRARIAGQLLSCEQVNENLEIEVAHLRERLKAAEGFLATAQARRSRLSGELESLDCVVKVYDDRLDPTLIEPINGWAGKYGKRGALRKFLRDTLEGSSPEYLSTHDLEIRTVNNFALTFVSAAERRSWYMGPLRSTLKLMAQQGIIERSPDKLKAGTGVGKWRWTQPEEKTLADL